MELAGSGPGEELNRSLCQIAAKLDAPVDGEVNSCRQAAEIALVEWAEKSKLLHAEQEAELKEIIGTVARVAEAVSQRDVKHARDVGSLAQTMEAIAEITDVAQMRRSILDRTQALRACVEKMTADSKLSMLELKRQVSDYRVRLEESERRSSIDPLTGLSNRRAFETELAARVASVAPFSLILIDLNDFKLVNDRHGHLAGDDLLRQFATELNAQFNSGDLVGRWGGDEFVVLVSGLLSVAQSRADRIRIYCLGTYKVASAKKTLPVVLHASVSIVERRPRETGPELLARADALLYETKKLSTEATDQLPHMTRA